MRSTEYHITVTHGSLSIKVPRDLFYGPECEPVEDKVNEFREMLKKRYPWLTDNGLDVFMRNARKEMLRVIDEETGGRTASKQMASKGKFDDAIKHLKEHLERDPEDADSWYTLGELLCKSGKVEEGYKAMNRGRALIEKNQ